MSVPIVKMTGVTKYFPGVVALDNVDFEIRPGEVHVLLGENGAGKSTLMKILSGAYQPDKGSVEINGKKLEKITPKIAIENGISIIYQELSVVGWLSIAENIFMGRLPVKNIGPVKYVDSKKLLDDTKVLLDGIKLEKNPSELVSNLNISEKQMAEIAKAVSYEAQVIVMDEPTSSLTEEEVNKLFIIINNLKAQGKGIVYITHKMKEILAIGDRVTIMKDGTYVGTHNVCDVTMDDMVRMMVGRELKYSFQGEKSDFTENEVLLEAQNITRKDEKVKNASFKLHKGEILGFSGLIGAGRTELMTAIYGAAKIKEGSVLLEGKRLRIDTPYDALKQGIGLVTENRRETGFFKNFDIKSNTSIAKQLKDSKLQGLYGLLDKKEEIEIAKTQCEAMKVRCASIDQNITDLSGGNQQKVILGKWMAAGVKVLIFDEPTKGIDVGTKTEIYKLMRNLVNEGIGVIVISSELPELLSVCDRIAVMSEGEIRDIFNRESATEEKLIKAATKQH